MMLNKVKSTLHTQHKSSNSSHEQKFSKPILLIIVLLACASSVLPTKAPVIGIVAQELWPIPSLVRAFPNHTSYIAASYVKNIEAAGARVVPIFIGRDRDYYA